MAKVTEDARKLGGDSSSSDSGSSGSSYTESDSDETDSQFANDEGNSSIKSFKNGLADDDDQKTVKSTKTHKEIPKKPLEDAVEVPQKATQRDDMSI